MVAGIGRLEIAVDDTLLVGVLYSLADAGEKLEPLADTQFGFIAELVQRQPVDPHDKEGPTILRQATVQDLGFGWSIGAGGWRS